MQCTVVCGASRREFDACDVRLYVVPSSKVDRALKKLEDSGYDAGPEPSSEFSLCEGDRLEIAFRGNVKCVDGQPRLSAVFTTNLDTSVCMHIEQHDVFVQKSYNVYRGFVQLRKVTKIPLAPGAADKKAGVGTQAPPPPPPPPQQQQQPAATTDAAAPVAQAPESQDVEAAATAGGGDASAAPAEEVAVVEEPPPPMFEIKVAMLSELLITFPKVGFAIGFSRKQHHFARQCNTMGWFCADALCAHHQLDLLTEKYRSFIGCRCFQAIKLMQDYDI